MFLGYGRWLLSRRVSIVLISRFLARIGLYDNNCRYILGVRLEKCTYGVASSISGRGIGTFVTERSRIRTIPELCTLSFRTIP